MSNNTETRREIMQRVYTECIDLIDNIRKLVPYIENEHSVPPKDLLLEVQDRCFDVGGTICAFDKEILKQSP